MGDPSSVELFKLRIVTWSGSTPALSKTRPQSEPLYPLIELQAQLPMVRHRLDLTRADLRGRSYPGKSVLMGVSIVAALAIVRADDHGEDSEKASSFSVNGAMLGETSGNPSDSRKDIRYNTKRRRFFRFA